MYFSPAKFNFSSAKFFFCRRKKNSSSRWHWHKYVIVHICFKIMLPFCIVYISHTKGMQKTCRITIGTYIGRPETISIHTCNEMITCTESQIDTALYKLWFRSSTQLWHTKKLFYYEKSFPKKLFAVHVPSETRKWQPFISHFFVSLNNFYSSPTIIYKLGT